MAAALATIRILERDNVTQRLHDSGEALSTGLRDKAERHGLQISLSGPPALPFLTFANESNFHRNQHFVREMLKQGVFVHPHHNWFLCAAHGPAEVDRALEAADEAFASVRSIFGD